MFYIKYISNSIGIVLFCSHFSFAQNTIKGFVTDYQNTPIPYTSIYDSTSGQGTYSDSNGYFTMVVEKFPLTLGISNVGYHSRWVVIPNSENINIRLEDRLINLKEITITDEKYESKYLGTPKKEKGLFTHVAWGPFDQIGIMVNNKNNVLYNNPHLISFSIKVARWSYLGSKLGVKPNGKKQLRLRMYKLNKNKLVGEDILHENIFLSPSKKGWYTIDLENENIKLPNDGFVMAVEWIENNSLYLYNAKDELGKKVVNRNYGLGINGHKMSDSERTNYTLVWSRSIWDNIWKVSPWININEYIPCFRLEFIELGEDIR